MPESIVLKSFKESLKAKEKFFSGKNVSRLVEAATAVADSFKAGGKLLIIGNGGSAADAQHLAAEFVNRFEIERPPLPAIALTTDSSILTSISNDYDFKETFSKQVKALGRRGDVLLAVSTSGKSPNVIKGVEAAKSMGILTIAFSGKDGGALADKADMAFVVQAASTARIQEVHITAGHILCELVDDILFKGGAK